MTTRTQLAYAAAGVVLVLGLLSLLNPWLAARLLGFELAVPRAVSEVRATYGALHVAMAALLLWAIPLRPRAALVVRVVGLLWAAAAAGRLASAILDAVVGPWNLGLLLVQLAVAALLLWAAGETPPPAAEVRARRDLEAARRRAADLRSGDLRAGAAPAKGAPSASGGPPAAPRGDAPTAAAAPRTERP